MYKIRRRGNSFVLDICQRGRGPFEPFLRYEAHLLGRISSSSEFFFRLPSHSAGLSRIVDNCADEELVRVSHRDKHVTLAQPGTWEGFVSFLRKLIGANYNGVDGFAVAAPGYIPRPGFFSGAHWFRRHLADLKCFCLFYLEYPRLELWAKRGVDESVDEVFDELRGKAVKQHHRKWTGVVSAEGNEP